MILTIKNRAIYYRRFEKDIWGILKTTYPKPIPEQISRQKRWKFIKEKRVKWFEEPEGVNRLTRSNKLRVKYYKWSRRKFRWTNKFSVFSQTNRFNRIKNPKWVPENLINLKKKLKIKMINRSSQIYPWKQNSNKMSRILDFFYKLQDARKKERQKRKQPYIYRLDIIERRTIKRYLKYRFVSLRLVKLFYINYNYRKFRSLSNRMRKKAGMFEWNFLLQLEGRLMSFIYRTSFVANIFQCMQLIKQGHVYVNFKNFPYVNHIVQVGDFLTFSSLGKKLIYLMLVKRLAKKITLFNAPGYIYVSYGLLYAYMKRPPLKKQLVFPIAIDLYRATGYAF